ncbi:MAG: TIGR02678 family protein [Clostridiales bacterium]|nr:TIGR02678 family protein [Clostridiales bacterium]
MEHLKFLLEHHFVYKEANRELYYTIYDSQKEFKPFLDKLGYQLIVRTDFLRLEKLPADIDEFMGVSEFKTVEEYILLMLLLIFLEEKTKEDQFLLADVVEFFEGNGKLTLDTTKQSTRRQICRVFNYAKDNYLIKLCDGNIDRYITDSAVQVLYDNTGLSKYFVLNFSPGLAKCERYEDVRQLAAFEAEQNIVAARRNTVYRNLLLRPAVYNQPSPYDEYGYIKNFRSNIAEDFAAYLGWTLHVHKEASFVIPAQSDKPHQAFPGKDGQSAAALLFNLEIRKRVDSNQLLPDNKGEIYLSNIEFLTIATHVKETKGAGLIQELRNMTNERFSDALKTYLQQFMFCRVDTEGIVLLPAIGKIVGDYPKSFYTVTEDRG